MFHYSLPFPGIWICCVVACKLAPAPGFRLGIVDASIIYMGIASLIGWLFARNERRDFTATEYRNLILCCIGWSWLFEARVFWELIFNPAYVPLPNRQTACLGVLLTMALTSLFIWLAFRSFGWWTIRWQLEDRAGAKTPAPPNPPPPDAASKPSDTRP